MSPSYSIPSLTEMAMLAASDIRHTLLRSKWNPALALLPVESMVHDRQDEYYSTINASNGTSELTVFTGFMLLPSKHQS